MRVLTLHCTRPVGGVTGGVTGVTDVLAVGAGDGRLSWKEIRMMIRGNDIGKKDNMLLIHKI